jgi:hypothetical protein
VIGSRAVRWKPCPGLSIQRSRIVVAKRTGRSRISPALNPGPPWAGTVGSDWLGRERWGAELSEPGVIKRHLRHHDLVAKTERPGDAGPSENLCGIGTASGRLILDHGLITLWGFAAARALGQCSLDFLDGLGLGNALHR